MGWVGNSSQSSANTMNQRDEIVGLTGHCFCGQKVKMKTFWSLKNPGRGFLTCPKEIDRGCKLFQWVDLYFPSQANKAINQLKEEKRQMQSYNFELHGRMGEVKAAMEKLKSEFEEKLAKLEVQLVVSEARNVRGKWLRVLCVILVVLLVQLRPLSSRFMRGY